jgi:hypothetical protein
MAHCRTQWSAIHCSQCHSVFDAVGGSNIAPNSGADDGSFFRAHVDSQYVCSHFVCAVINTLYIVAFVTTHDAANGTAHDAAHWTAIRTAFREAFRAAYWTTNNATFWSTLGSAH